MLLANQPGTYTYVQLGENTTSLLRCQVEDRKKDDFPILSFFQVVGIRRFRERMPPLDRSMRVILDKV